MKKIIFFVGLNLILSQSPMHQFSEFIKPQRMSNPELSYKVGQMIMLGFRGTELADTMQIIRDIRHNKIGGVVLYDYDVPSKNPVRNIVSSEQLKKLCSDLQVVENSPLLIAIDQEGGKIRRLKEKLGFPATATHQEMGSKNEEKFTRENAEKIASLLSDHGINMNFAPVVDLNINPESPAIGALERSFGEQPKIVLQNAEWYIDEHRQQSLLTCIKHFPGHGSASSDSHLEMVDVTDSWSQFELSPYEALIGKGMVDAVMTAHVFIRYLDEDLPATLSPVIINKLLRDHLNFDGVVISDDIQMGAIRENYGFEEALVRSINAGVDIIIFSNNSTFDEMVGERAIDIIKRNVRSGRISEKRIDESWERIKALKKKLPEWLTNPEEFLDE